ncbi:MAG: hypothetical protein IT436_18840 [Phycisphaerales bacterium]|nr:hypothetical protein [Phycisphaerales bacterium]
MARSRRRRSKANQKVEPSTAAAPRGLTRLSVADLEREIRRRQRGTVGLHRRRAKLLAKIEALDAEILAAGGTLNGRTGRAAGGGRIRPRNDSTLIEALAGVLKGKTMSVTEAAEAVQRAGYRTSAANFRTMVNIALIKSGKFKRVERGKYTAA